ncbi:HET-domain-containing protein [Mycena sanguinolenta]|uniref:HET-domain-containing protein n=1 Tax=Mycena sanguinolenta TaxID=230812 RepID=A0A8H6Z2E5_9AGAR|nr:HET-domain-containing protein [Mycena sanguinolenta]
MSSTGTDGSEASRSGEPFVPGRDRISQTIVNHYISGGQGGPGGQGSNHGGGGGLGEGPSLHYDVKADHLTMNMVHSSFAAETALSEGQHEMKTMLAKLDDNDIRGMMQRWLKPAHVGGNYQEASNKRHPGTGKWLLENSSEFSKWLDSPPSFLWLHGISGSGKTVLSSMVVDRIRGIGAAYAFFYFDINSPNQQKINNLLCSLVHQLSIQLFCPDLLKLWESCQKGEFLPSNANLLQILEDFCRQEEVYLLIDALDESSERDMLLKVLASILGTKQPKMHLIVTSRTEITHFDITKEAVLVSLEDSVRRDIELYVGDELSKMGGYIAKNKDSIRQELLDKGDGMFRLVALQLEALGKSGGTKSKVNKVLATMPTTLTGIYDRILQMTEIHEQVCRTMIWLIFSMEEIILGEIIDALAFDFSDDKLRFDKDERMDPQTFLDACGSLISVPQNWDNASVVRLSHASVRDYFLDMGSNKWKVEVSDQQAQSLIAKTCLAYFDSFDMGEADVFATALHYPLIGYASNHWADHLNRYQNFAQDSMLCDLFLELLHDNNPRYNLFRNYTLPFDLGPPLCLVAYMGIQHGIPLVLKRDADVNVQGGEYNTALQAAACRGHINIVCLLLEHQADHNILGGKYGIALQAAADQQSIAVVQMLLEHQADPNIRGGKYGTALQAAARRGNIDIVHLLLEHHADPKILGGKYHTALQAAAKWGHIETVKLLLQHNADVNIQGGKFGTALQGAAAWGSMEIVELLLKHGADVNLEGGVHGNALKAATAERYSDIVQLLQAHSASF